MNINRPLVEEMLQSVPVKTSKRRKTGEVKSFAAFN